MLNDNELKNKLFEFMFELLISHGGDGDVAYKGANWQENANLFEEWSKNHHPNFLTRNNNEKYTTFHNDQECIYFCNQDFNELNYADIISTHRI